MKGGKSLRIRSTGPIAAARHLGYKSLAQIPARLNRPVSLYVRPHKFTLAPMEQLKPQHALTMPDSRQAGFSIYDFAIGSFRPYTLDDLYKSLSTINLHSGVPEEIRSHFSTAQNLVAFSWHHYPFNVTAQLMGHVTIEFALRQLYPNMTNRSFKKLVELAVKEGRISEKGFSHYVEPETSHLPPELKDI